MESVSGRVLSRRRKLAFAVSMLAMSFRSMGTESGQIHYPIGINTIADGILPAPGDTEFYLYTQHYYSTRLNDGRGNSVDQSFSAKVYAVAPRFVHTWKESLGPFSVSSGVILPMTSVDVRIFGRKDHSVGFGDPFVELFYLNYVNRTGTFFAFFGPGVYVPIGNYDKNRLANNGLHYWSFAPSLNLTWLPAPRWEVSSTVYAELNATNKATHYRSGNSVDIDFAVGWRPFLTIPKLKVALQGYALKQYSDDRQDGVSVSGGNRGRALGVGPQISYDLAGGKGGVLIKYQREFLVQNRSMGNRFWFELALPL